jgi:hypothetical protein
MGLIRDQPGVVVPVQGGLPPGVLGEVRAHQAGCLSPDEIVARQVFAGGVVERMWAWLTQCT